MNLYLITAEVEGWDVYSGHVIRAENETQVRNIAKKEAADEGEEVWETATIEVLAERVKGEVEIVLSDFHAG